MSGIRDLLGLAESDIDDIATFIYFATPSANCPAAAPAVGASTTSLTFGNVKVGASSGGQSITITNSGAGDATGMSYPSAPVHFSKGGTCTNGALAAGTSCTVVFTFSPTAAGTFSPTYTITGGGGINIPISLSGTGVAASAPNIQVSTSSLDFGSVNVGQTSPVQTITVSNTGTAVATNMAYPAAPPKFTKGGTCASTTLNAGQNCSVTFTYTPTAVGPDNATYTIGGAGGPFPILLTGSGAAAVPAALSATPTSLAFGSVSVGSTSAAQALHISNTGGATATGISLINGNASEFPVTGSCSTIAAGSSCTVNVAYKPSSAASDAANLTINYAGGTPVVVAMSGTGTAAASPNLSASPALIPFGNVTVGQTSSVTVITVTNSGGAQATGITFANSNAAEFPVSSNTCGATLNAGASCSLSAAYAPGTAGAASASLTFNYAGGGVLSIALSGTGVATAPPPGTGSLSMVSAVAMPDQTLGTSSAPWAVTLSNASSATVIVSSIASSNASEFSISGSTCTTVSAGASCSFNITFTPAATGGRSSTVTVTGNGAGSPQAILVSGNGVAGGGVPPPNTITAVAVEYYHASFDHYFITSITDEITKLDNGAFVGWARTGRSFKVRPSPGKGLNAVCRFFSTAFGAKSSHFYTPNAPECTIVKANAAWMFEDEVFFIAYPELDGTCPADTIPVYRMYNNGQGGAPNHRYTTDLDVRSQMLAQGWIPEGEGKIGVIMCSPQ